MGVTVPGIIGTMIEHRHGQHNRDAAAGKQINFLKTRNHETESFHFSHSEFRNHFGNYCDASFKLERVFNYHCTPNSDMDNSESSPTPASGTRLPLRNATNAADATIAN